MRGIHGAEATVTVHSMGGLGNQLFIYAAGLAAARAAGAWLRVDIGPHAVRVDRPFMLEALGFPAEYVDLGLTAPRYGLRGQLRRGGLRQGCSFREKSLRFDPVVLKQPPGSCLFGFFQSARYVEPVAELMRAHLARLEGLTSVEVRATCKQLSRSRAIVLHVRRGDYTQAGVRNWHGLAGIHYYQRAVGNLRRMGFDGPLYVISDEVEKAIVELADVGPVSTVTEQPLGSVDELLLMMRAPALVTANSSFSWWAAWGGDSPSRPVVCPRPWFADVSLDSRDLLAPHWLTLDSRPW